MTTTFKGQLITPKYILSFAAVFAVIFGGCFLAYYFKIYDLLFQLLTFVVTGPTSFIIFLVPPLLLSLYLSFKIVTCFYPTDVTLFLNGDQLEVDYGNERIAIVLKEVNAIKFTQRNENWQRITITTKQTTNINVGSFFNGIKSQELDLLFAQLKMKLVENYQLFYQKSTPTANNFTYSLKKTEQKSHKKLIAKIALICAAIFIPFVVALTVTLFKSDGHNLLHAKSYPASNFSHYEGKVYALKPGDGYFEVKDADIKSFKPLLFENEYGTITGADKNNVYSSDQIIPEIDRNKAQYLGLSYIKDDKNVFYQTQRIADADVNTFQALKHSAGFNTIHFRFAKDNNNVYYKDQVVEKADPTTIRTVDETLDYVKDDRHAFYRAKLLPNVNVAKFFAIKTQYQIVYASDGRKHFVNGISFPKKVQNKLWGTTTVDMNQLVNLQQPSDNTRHLLFSDQKAIYYFDDQRNEFICAAEIPNLKPAVGGSFTDGSLHYFTQSTTLRTRKFGSYGSRTNIYSRPNQIKDLEILYRMKKSTVYKSEDGYYFSENQNAISLRKIKDFNRFNAEIIKPKKREVPDNSYFEPLVKPKLVLKILTRNRTNFEDENK